MREMKDSGIAWIGEIPKEWKIGRLKNVCYGFSNGTSAQQTSTGETNFAVTRIETISQGIINYDKVGYIESFDGIEKFKLNIGDILISNINSFAHVGKCSMYYGEHDLYHGMNLLRISPKQNIDSKFLLLFLKSKAFISQMQSACKPAINQVSVPSSTIKHFYIPIFPIPEQQRIATFLDEKCKEIDDLMALQEEMITELQAYKQSVITEAVTKGLNPNASMKDSGVEWIGEIPEHWEIIKLRYLGILQNGISKGGNYFGEGYPFMNYGDVYQSMFIKEPLSGLAKSNSQDQELYSVQKGDVFFTRTSETKEEIGFSSVCLKSIDQAIFSGFLIRFRPNTNKLLPIFSGYYFRSNIHRQYFVKEMNLVTRASLGQNLLKDLPVLLPPLSEQQAIADYLDTQYSRIDKLIALKRTKIEELQDYKKSVIYEYVTGKKEVPATV